MKRIALLITLLLVASFAYAGDGDVAISDARGNKSLLGDYNTTTKRIKTDTSGNLIVTGDATGSLTVDNPALSVVGGGAEATAQRVTIANDSTGLLSVDDNAGSLTVDGTVDTNILAPATHGSGQKTVTAAGTAEAIAASTACLSVTIRAHTGNTNNIYVGNSGVDSSNGFILDSAEGVTLDIDNIADVYIDADTNGEGVSFIYVVE